MAKIIKKGTDLEETLRGYRRSRRICSVIGALLLITGFAAITLFDEFKLVVGGGIVSGVAFILLMFGLLGHGRDIEIISAGIRGEREALRCVANLPDAYTVFVNLSLTYRDKKSEMDLVVVGPTGVFIIEIKNQNGVIVGDVAERNWIQHKVGRGGTPYSKSFYNPVKQVGTHVYVLANYLKSSAVRAYVSPAVYFANAETDVRVSGSDGKTELFAASQNGAGELIRYITGNRSCLSQEEYNKIIRILAQA